MMKLTLSRVALLVLASSCGKDKNSSSDSNYGNGTLQGVVWDSTVNNRLSLNETAKVNRIYAIVGGKQVDATFFGAEHRPEAKDLSLTDLDASDRLNESMQGEYAIHGLPTDVQFPVVFEIDGYERAEFRAMIHSTIAQKSQNTMGAGDLKLTNPMITLDTELRRRGSANHTLDILVCRYETAAGSCKDLEDATYNRYGWPSPIKSAALIVLETGGDDSEGCQVVTKSENGDICRVTSGARGRSKEIIRGTSDETGKFSIKADKLVIGKPYDVVVVDPNTKSRSTTRVVYSGKHGLEGFALEDQKDQQEFSVIFPVIKPK